MTKEGLILDAGQQTLEIKGCIIPLQSDEYMSMLVRLNEEVTIPPNSAVYAKVKRTRNSLHKDGIYMREMAETGILSSEPGVVLPASVHHIEKGKWFTIALINTSGGPYDFKKGSVIGRIERVDISQEIPSPIIESEHLREEVRENKKVITLDELLEQNKDLFAETDHDLGCTDILEMKINTGDHPPIASKPYRVPMGLRHVIEEQVSELLDTGLITESQSPWSSPVVLVTKPDSSYRLCCDFRKLNSMTIEYNYPLPHIDDLLGMLGGSTCFSFLDCRSGYYQIRVAEEDKEKTAFVCHKGCYSSM